MTHVPGNKDNKKEEIRLSRHDYSKYSNKKYNIGEGKPEKRNNRVIETPVEIKMEVEATETSLAHEPVEFINETVQTAALPETVTGTVINCAKLNVRATPSISADVVCVLDVTSEIEIDVAKSNREWFHVCTAAGMEGYCMRKFVEAHL